MTDIDNTQDIINVSDITDRVEELETHQEETSDTGSDTDQEYDALKSLLNDLKSRGGDHQWRGDWYPAALIRDDHFEQAMDELLEDIGDIKRYEDRPSYIKITVDYDALKMDYTSCEYNGVTYWFR